LKEYFSLIQMTLLEVGVCPEHPCPAGTFSTHAFQAEKQVKMNFLDLTETF
jgi:hypothetical protein